MLFARAVLGLTVLCGMCWLLSSHRDRFPWRVVVWGIALQIALGLWILRTDSGTAVFNGIASGMQTMVSRTVPGAELVFGSLARADGPAGFVFAFAGTGLVVILFFAALMGVLYYLGVMQVVIWALGRVMSAFLGVSGAESMAVAAEIFVGQTESPLSVRPYIARMTLSELNAMMTAGFATIAGSVMAVYMGFLGPEYAPHLLSASVMSAPAAFVCAKIVRPEVERAQTAGRVPLVIDRGASNVLEAAANGTADGLKLYLNVIAMLIAFTALVMLVDWPLEWLGETLAVEGGLSLGRIFGWIFAPVAWAIGIEGWHDCQGVGSLLGIKLALNELIAYQHLAAIQPERGAANALEHVRSAQMATYALCGFANLASIGVQIGGTSQLAPERRGDIVRLAFKAMLAGAIATCMTATVAGMFV